MQVALGLRRLSSMAAASRVTLRDINKLYEARTGITMVTCYTAPQGSLAQAANIPMILVGDSAGMVEHGLPSPSAVTMDAMVLHTCAVARGMRADVKRPFIVGDLPTGSYLTVESALNNAFRFLKEADVDAVKLEGGRRMADRVAEIVKAGLPVVGHIGLTPQSAAALSGFVAQGRSAVSAVDLLKDALALEDAGCSAIVLECIPAAVSEVITAALAIPTIGIGSGPQTSGQVQVLHDLLGMSPPGGKTPRHAARLADVYAVMLDGLTRYRDSVVARTFPTAQHSFTIAEAEHAKFVDMAGQITGLRAGQRRSFHSLASGRNDLTPSKGAALKAALVPLRTRLLTGEELKAAVPGFGGPAAARVCIVGGGALGSLFAGLLSRQKDLAVNLVTSWRDHMQVIDEDGLRIRARAGDAGAPPAELVCKPVAVHAGDIDSIAGTADLVVVMVKGPGTAAAAATAARVAKPDGTILTLQNGIHNWELIKAAAGERTVLCGATRYGAMLLSAGNVLHTGVGRTVLGSMEELPADVSADLSAVPAVRSTLAVASVLQAAGIDVEIGFGPRTMGPVLWSKLAVNSVINPISALLGVRNGAVADLLRLPAGAQLCNDIVNEVAAVATAKGIDIRAQDLIKDVVQATATNTSSMLADVQRSVPTEVDFINGAVATEASKIGVPVPVSATIQQLLHLREAVPKLNSYKSDGSLQVADSIAKLKALRRSILPHMKVGFVPTMGALHDGHVSLCREAKKECDYVFVSIFVNPTQFAAHEDLHKYPRTFENDLALLRTAGVDAVFAPRAAEIHPPGATTSVVNPLANLRPEGQRRPHFFQAVATVVCKLLHIVGPDFAYFGQKDAQQCAVLRQMAQDLFFPVEIRIAPTIREADGLAMSSRNRYLSPAERSAAPIIFDTLTEMVNRLNSGAPIAEVVAAATARLAAEPTITKIEYISVGDALTMADLTELPSPRGKDAVCISLAVITRDSGTRLIDNVLM